MVRGPPHPFGVVTGTGRYDSGEGGEGTDWGTLTGESWESVSLTSRDNERKGLSLDHTWDKYTASRGDDPEVAWLGCECSAPFLMYVLHPLSCQESVLSMYPALFMGPGDKRVLGLNPASVIY